MLYLLLYYLHVYKTGGFMKKFICAVFVLGLSFFAFAEKYRYLIISQTDANSGKLIVMDVAEPVPKEQLSDTINSVNTKKERIEVEAGLRNIEYMYYNGSTQLMYIDASKDPNSPDMQFIVHGMNL